MNVRSLIICSALLPILFASSAFAGGKFQRTKDGKALVWNGYPEPGETVSWSGDRDDDGYATGYGTVTWYQVERKVLTGFQMPLTKHTTKSIYTGKMKRGKLQGMVKLDTKGKLYHAKFVDGRKVGKWAAGAGPAPAPEKPVTETVPRAELVEGPPTSEPPPPAQGPIIAPDEKVTEPAQESVTEAKIEKPIEATEVKTTVAQAPARPATPPPATSSAPVNKPPAQVAAAPVAKGPPQTAAKPAPPSKDEFDDSLRSLVGPPSSLRTQDATAPAKTVPPPAASVENHPRLVQAEVIGLADAEARVQGVELGSYEHPQAKYNAAGDNWTVVYNSKADPNAGEIGKDVTVTIEDKTKKTTVSK